MRRWWFGIVGLSLCLSWTGWTASEMSTSRHVLVVGVGGCRPDALRAANAPCLKGLASSGTVSWVSSAGGVQGSLLQPTLSGPGWCSVLTGVWSNRHHVVDDTFSGYVPSNAPHFFTRVREFNPAAYLSSIVEWPALDTFIAGAAGTNCNFHQVAVTGVTTDLVAKATAHLAATNPDVLFLEFEAAEVAGRASGFSVTNGAYLAALAGIDNGVAQILGAIRARPSYSSEQWMIMVVSDHGGTNLTSGGQSADERTVMVIVNGPGIIPQRTLSPGPGQTCVPPTVLAWLGAEANHWWNFDSPLFGLPVTTALAVYLNFDNTLAASGGTAHSAVAVGPHLPHYTNGVVGAAAAFANTEPSLNAIPLTDWAGSLGNLDAIYTNDFSVSMWIMSTQAVGGAFAGNKDWTAGGNTGWVVSAFTMETVNWRTDAGVRQDIQLQPAFSNSKWHHVAVVFQRSANRVTTYMDGVMVQTNTVDGVAGHDGHTSSLGSGYLTLVGASGPPDPTFGVNGWLDEYAMWTRPLGAGEVSELYLRGQIGQALTNFYWPVPQLLTQPVSSSNVEYGAGVTFSLSYTGLFSTCQWYYNGAPIAGATNIQYSLPWSQAGDIGGYSATIGNNGGVVTTAVATLTVLPRPYSPVTNGLVVHLPLDGSLAAAAGTAVSGTVYTGTPRYVAGMIRQAASFSNDYSRPSPSDWAVSLGSLEPVYSNDFTVALWVRTSRLLDDAFIGNKNWSSGNMVGWVISSYAGENVNWCMLGGTRRDLALPLSDGAWHHVVFSFSRTTNQACVYMDGIMRTNCTLGAATTNSLNAGYPTLLGASGPGTYGATADFDDVAIWSRVLSPVEVRSVFLNGKLDASPLQTPLAFTNITASGKQLVLGWPLTGFSVQTTTNLSGVWSNVVPSTLSTNRAAITAGAESQRFFRLSN